MLYPPPTHHPGLQLLVDTGVKEIAENLLHTDTHQGPPITGLYSY